MTNWCFFVTLLSFKSFLLGFHYRQGVAEEEGQERIVEIHELGIGFLSIGFEKYH